MSFEFKRKRIDSIPQERMLAELEKTAKHFNYIEFGRRDFDKFADISSNVVMRHFGSWKNGLEAVRNSLRKKGLDLSPRPYSKQRIYSDKELFDEMEQVWQKVGQRPSRIEWRMANSTISHATYSRRFGSWAQACLKFIEYRMGGNIEADDFVTITNDEKPKKEVKYNKELLRDVPLSLRLKILDRDSFRCVFCGRSPATDVGVRLHIDHKIPFSKGGKSTIDNLQTLCHDCNLGKSNVFVKT